MEVRALVSVVRVRQKSIYLQCCVGRRAFVTRVSPVQLKFWTFFSEPTVVNFTCLDGLFLEEMFRNSLDTKTRQEWF